MQYNHVRDVFENNGKMTSWEDLRAKLDFDKNKIFYCWRIIHTIPLG